MSLIISKKSLITLTLLLFVSVTVSVFADESSTDVDTKDQSLDGKILLPDDYNKSEEKKCITVCEQWGEDCIINPRTGSRNCRRVCKSFTEECF